MTYEIDIAGLKRELPLCAVSDSLSIAAFVIFGDVEMTKHAAKELLKRVPEFDYIIAPEAKAIPLAYEMAAQIHAEKYFIARKKAKVYLTNPLIVNVKSITSDYDQTLILSGEDAAMIKGKKMLLLDDVISTGESIRALEELVIKAGGIVAGRAAVLAEGDAYYRKDITVLGQLPLFNADGTVK